MVRRFARLVARSLEPPEGDGPWSRLAVLLGLSGFAVAQPILAILGEEPTWFSFRSAGRAEIVLFALTLALAPAAALWILVSVAGMVHRRAGWCVQLTAVGLLVGIAVQQLIKQVGLTAPAAQIAIAGGFALGAAFAYALAGGVRSWAQLTAVLPAIALAQFLFMSPVKDLVLPPDIRAADRSVREDAPPILVLVLDELPTRSLLAPDGTVDAVHLPNFAALADGSTWYVNHTSTAQGTLQAVPALLTGGDPRPDPPTPGHYPDNLFTLLAPGYDLEVVEAATQLCPPDLCGSTARRASARGGVGDLLREAAELWRARITPGDNPAGVQADFVEELEEVQAQDLGLGADVVTRPEALAAFLSAMETPTSPTLWFLHLVLPHGPWHLYPDGTSYDPGPWIEPDRYPFDTKNESGAWIAALTEQRHLLQLHYTDALLGEVIDRLKAIGAYDDTLVVVTADHGISFELNAPQRSPVDANLGDLAFVPLFVKEPGQTEGVVDRSNTSIHDLLPTLAEFAGAPVTWEVAGSPLGSVEQRARDSTKRFYDFGSGFKAAFQGIFHFDQEERAPSARRRWIGAVGADDPPLAGLLLPLGVGDLLGRSLDDVVTGRELDLTVELDDADALRSPPTSRAPGIVAGTVASPDAREGDLVVVEVNGAVTTASPVIEFRERPGRFFAMLPPGMLEERNEIRLALRRDGTLSMVTLS